MATGRVFDRAKGDPSLLPDAFPCAADAHALPEAHHWQNAVSVSHGAGLVPDFVVFHPVLDLLVGHVEVALLLVQGGHFGHFFRAQFKVEDRDGLRDRRSSSRYFFRMGTVYRYSFFIGINLLCCPTRRQQPDGPFLCHGQRQQDLRLLQGRRYLRCRQVLSEHAEDDGGRYLQAALCSHGRAFAAARV